ncbi:MAG: UbiX family flavin prenyltransferase [Planctomycetes bacterium]|nr:UbiX family flavin prenyltransferase [Planctomycetota bacterium]
MPARRSRAPRAAPDRTRRFFLGLTGASGHPYALALARALLERGHALDVSATAAGLKVLRHECGLDIALDGSDLGARLASALGLEQGDPRLRVFDASAIEAPPSSGTALTGAVILCPCSMGSLARVSAGFSSNLVERAADVALKEGRTLILVVREAPYSAIHLENMLRMARLGAVILPASPGFYHRPRTLEDLVRHVVGKVLDRAGVAHEVSARWSGFAASGPAPEPPDEEGVEPRGRAGR